MATRATRARQIASYIGAGVIPGQGGGGTPVNALISRANNLPILSRATNQILTARVA